MNFLNKFFFLYNGLIKPMSDPFNRENNHLSIILRHVSCMRNKLLSEGLAKKYWSSFRDRMYIALAALHYLAISTKWHSRNRTGCVWPNSLMLRTKCVLRTFCIEGGKTERTLHKTMDGWKFKRKLLYILITANNTSCMETCLILHHHFKKYFA